MTSTGSRHTLIAAQTVLWVVFQLVDFLLSIVYYPATWLMYKAHWRPFPSATAGDTSYESLSEESCQKTVVVVGASFGGLKCVHQLAYTPGVRVVLIDAREYFEYTPGILRLFCDPSLFGSLAGPIPTGSHEFLLGTVTAVNSDHVVVLSSGFSRRVGFDCLVLATGADYRQPITASATDCTLAARQAAWEAEAARLKAANSVLVLGGGPVGVELAAEVKDHFPEKQVTLLNGPSHLVPLFPPQTAEYAEEWCRCNGVELLLNRRVQDVGDTVCTLDDGTILWADIIYVCIGMRPNSKLLAAGDFSGCVGTSGQVRVNQYLQVLHHPHIFAVGDVMCNPSNELKQAYYAEMNGELAGHNVLLFLEGKPLLRFPEDMVGADFAPLVYVVSLGRFSASLGFNAYVINGSFAALMKWVLEWLKVRQMEGRPIGLLGFGVGDRLTAFLSRTCMRPPQALNEDGL